MPSRPRPLAGLPPRARAPAPPRSPPRDPGVGDGGEVDARPPGSGEVVRWPWVVVRGWRRTRTRGCAPAGGDGARRGAQTRAGLRGAGPPRVGSLPPDASPFLLHLLVRSVLLTSWPPGSGGFSLALEPSSSSPLPVPRTLLPQRRCSRCEPGCSGPGGWPSLAGSLPFGESRRNDQSRL